MYEVVRRFEDQIANWAGSRYAVAVSSCTNALFLCCKYLNVKWVHIPKRTYPGVPCSIIHAGGKVSWTDEAWSGVYRLRPYPIYDSALRFREKMYIKGSYYCLSFHAKKRINIGRGGMILTDDREAAKWFSSAKLDGRVEGEDFHKEQIKMLGWNCYMYPEQAARGLQLFQQLKNEGNQMDLVQEYPDLSKWGIYK